MSAENEKPDVDEVSGVETTGHEWDGIKELNNPLPKWWLYTFYATVIWAMLFTVFYPAWPLLTENTKGVLGYTTRGELREAVAEAKSEQAVYLDRIEALDVRAVAADPELSRFARAGGAAAFKTNCSQCHGSAAQGFPGYPNLLDDAWIWGGSLEAIHQTIAYGIRQTGPDGYETDETRIGEMSAFGRDGLLEEQEIDQVVEYVLSISRQEHDAALAAQGSEIFLDNCSGCHGEDGAGIREVGAPNLTDSIWLYGGSREVVKASIVNGRAGMMPAWEGRLDDATIKLLAVYVHSLGGGEESDDQQASAQ
ncbi:MAG: cytochrome-c oxidase, cbb3-type subunit III [Pseudomonadota bacterium]